ncbi:NAD-dependent epimerase/dehydratase family protein [Patescibacteria group bacterium]|nr:NAD-dependent epimerase/dehydratase family protein [Patescibacteria group bacterium]MBU1663670.1 NAD-dependent epimerase/dehydratase family protein [Patescibacteria group bacterium]MBU1933975.1 NAD-dependent epimerase/dehydratase family protein [Patescibacteria group bacterium]MBU2007963.1 NAD-dependent epimerase/dehydratase family protein [Patescibacteria group bacterium]MBU2233685.1 NAD-dependent epimerase/dehydratase family protein [Patescibacteria group bacterium]
MKILVTGGAGFIGSNLVDELINQENEVVVFDNLSNGKKENLNSKAKFYNADICSPAIDKIFKQEKFDYVFHLAAQIDVGVSVAKPEFDNKVNAMGSYNIFKNCGINKVKTVIFISTGGALYGDCLKPANEQTLIRPISPYAIHKYAAERYLELCYDLYNLNYVVLRLANVYGPRQYCGGECGVIGAYTYNIANNKPSVLYGDGSKTRDFVYVSDVVDACLKATSVKQREVFNIGNGKEISIKQIINTIKKAAGKQFIYKQEKDKLGEVQRNVLNSDKAKRILNWEPKVKLEQGLKNTIDWAMKK